MSNTLLQRRPSRVSNFSGAQVMRCLFAYRKTFAARLSWKRFSGNGRFNADLRRFLRLGRIGFFTVISEVPSREAVSERESCTYTMA